MTDARFAPHFEESCGCDPGCGHGSWCGADLHDVGGAELPEWPCDDVLALTGDASREAYNQREGDEYVARVQATCCHEFEGTDTCQWCGVVTPSRTDRQPPTSATGAKGGQGTSTGG